MSEVEELTVIPKDSTGRVTCFVVFKEVNILDRIDGLMLSFNFEGQTHRIRFSQALSKKQLRMRRNQQRQENRGRGGHQGELNHEGYHIPNPYPQFRREERTEVIRKRDNKESLCGRIKGELDGWIRYNVVTPDGVQRRNMKIMVGENLLEFNQFLNYYKKNENKKFLKIMDVARKVHFYPKIKKKDMRIHESDLEEFSLMKQLGLNFEEKKHKRSSFNKSNRANNDDLSNNSHEGNPYQARRGVDFEQSRTFSKRKGPGFL